MSSVIIKWKTVSPYKARLTHIHSHHIAEVTVLKEIETANHGFIWYVGDDGIKHLASDTHHTWRAI